MTRSNKGEHRIDGIDLLRGLAIFFVLMNHVNMRLRIGRIPYTQGLPEHLVNALFWNGEEGVRIFFAISGFLITAMTLRRWGNLAQVDARRFYLLRFARIAPLLLLLLGVLSALHLAGLSDFTVKPKTGRLGRALLAALTFHVNLLGIGIELFGPVSRASRVQPAVDRKGAGAIGPLVFEVGDLDRATAEAKAKGFRVVYEFGVPGERQVHFDDEQLFGYGVTFTERRHR